MPSQRYQNMSSAYATLTAQSQQMNVTPLGSLYLANQALTSAATAIFSWLGGKVWAQAGDKPGGKQWPDERVFGPRCDAGTPKVWCEGETTADLDKRVKGGGYTKNWGRQIAGPNSKWAAGGVKLPGQAECKPYAEDYDNGYLMVFPYHVEFPVNDPSGRCVYTVSEKFQYWVLGAGKDKFVELGDTEGGGVSGKTADVGATEDTYVNPQPGGYNTAVIFGDVPGKLRRAKGREHLVMRLSIHFEVHDRVTGDLVAGVDLRLETEHSTLKDPSCTSGLCGYTGYSASGGGFDLEHGKKDGRQHFPGPDLKKDFPGAPDPKRLGCNP